MQSSLVSLAGPFIITHQCRAPDSVGKPACRHAGMMAASWRVWELVLSYFWPTANQFFESIFESPDPVAFPGNNAGYPILNIIPCVPRVRSLSDSTD